MEENNNFVIKVLAIILIAILGLNVYRTENTRKEVAALTSKVEQLTARVDSLGMPAEEVPVEAEGEASVVSKGELSKLSKTVSGLESKLTALQGTVDRLFRAQSQSATVAPKASSPTASSQATAPAAGSTAAAPSSSTPVRVSVTAKVKVENRYVNGRTPLPAVTNGLPGTVVIGVTMNQIGDVNSASVKAGTTINDEDILDACKVAALKTQFSFNAEASSKHPGTITYTFTTK